jgi:DNA processing protein
MKNNTRWGVDEIIGLSLLSSIHGPLLWSIVGKYSSLETYCRYGLSQSLFLGNEQSSSEHIIQIGRIYREKHEEKNITIITFNCEHYPETLKHIDYPPPILYVKGSLNPSIGYAIVGTRNPTLYGQRVAEQYAEEFARHGICIISGLAQGIDTIAHRSTLNANGLTYAVIASGHEMISPKSAKWLSDEIIEKGGAIISEYSMNVKAKPPFFPRRNRIISGLSSAVLIIESGKSGGSMITAQFAFDQNRDLYVIPGSIHSPMSEGNHQLLVQQKAMLTQTPLDMLPEVIKHVAIPMKWSECDSNEHAILQVLGNEPLHIDEIIAVTTFTMPIVLSTLLALECRQLVKQMTGMNFIRLTHAFTLKS